MKKFRKFYKFAKNNTTLFDITKAVKTNYYSSESLLLI